ncbi:hypothetical protein [Actinoplanes sp. HUAS TT8]|uniref:hypothetical protein n=1 Tax=Actinoplanes sp. HUAS TT8 TaxID=3447453 RepID=UPI003F51FE81
MARLLVVLLGALAVVLVVAGPARSAPQAPAVDAACAQKAPHAVAWCMPWAVHVETPPAGATSHWVTRCSEAVSDEDLASCTAASLSLDSPAVDGTPSVLLDGPTDGKGLAALVDCSLFGKQMASEPQIGRRAMWRTKQAGCATASAAWVKAGFDPDPKEPDCVTADVSCRVEKSAEDAIERGIRSGVQGLVDVIVQAEVYLLSQLAGLVFSGTSIATPDQAFYHAYNGVAGTAVMLVFAFFLLSTVINGLRFRGGPSPLASLVGLVKAVIGITVAGGIAYVIVMAWDQAAQAALDANASKRWNPSIWIEGITGLSAGAGTLFLAAVLGIVAIIGLCLLFIMMMFRGMITTVAAIFSAMAMAGYAWEQTSHWPRKALWTINALGASKYVIVRIWIYAGESEYSSTDLITVLQSTLMIWLMVAAPFILLRVMNMWDGYLSDVNAHGMLSAFGGPLTVGSGLLDGVRQGVQDSQGTGEGGSDSAVSMMDANASSTPTNPAAQVGQMAGLGNGLGEDAAQAAGQGQDGEDVGAPVANPPGGEDDGQGQESAGQGKSGGEVPAPGDSTSDGGTQPVTPPAATGTSPAGAGHGDSTPASGADAGGDPATTAALGGPENGPASPDGSGVAASADPAATGPASSATTPVPAMAGTGDDRDDQASTSGKSGEAAGGTRGASAVADAPILPI